MKKSIIYSLAFIGAAALATGCSDNAWNNHLDGFDGDFNYTGTATSNYTLQSKDYDSIAAKLLDVAVTPEEIAAAKAIKSNKYFNQQSVYPAEIAVPYFLDNSLDYQYIYNNGSVANLTFSTASDVPEEVNAIAASTTYTLTPDNYQTVWGSSTQYVESFTPSHPASDYLPKILNSAISNPTEGAYAIVSYNTANENPDFSRAASVAPAKKKTTRADVALTSTIKDAADGSNLTATAVVTALDTRGCILTDNSGSILYYMASGFDVSQFPIGTVVNVSGTVSVYNRGLQLDVQKGVTMTAVGTMEYTYPEPKEYTGAMVDAEASATNNFLPPYISVQGKLNISGNYYNVAIDGASIQGSIYYATDALKATLTNGETYIYKGYYNGISGTSTKYFNFVLVEATKVSGGDEPTPPTPDNDLSDAIQNLSVGSTLNATAVVTAQCTGGLILTDNAGSIFYYNPGVNLSDYPLGTVVEVNGEVAKYNNGLQITNTATVTKTSTMTYTYPQPVPYTAAMIDAACAQSDPTLAKYVSITGKISIGSYYNVIIEGASAQGSIYYASDEVKTKFENDKSYTITGYFVQASGSSTKYFNIIVTDVVEYNGSSSTPTVNSYPEYAIYQYNGSEWTVPSNAAVVSPADYESMGARVDDLSGKEVTNYLPVFAKEMFPYAVSGDKKFIAYNVGNNTAACAVLVYSGGAWSVNNNNLAVVSAVFTKGDNKWTFSKWMTSKQYELFTGDSNDGQVLLNQSYLIVSNGVCASPLAATYNYGYLPSTSVVVDGDIVSMSNEDNSFTFVTTCMIDGETYTAPEGKFLIQDSYGRYLYMSGTYSSFNVVRPDKGDTPQLENGQIGGPYLFWAEKGEDPGQWLIINERSANYLSTIYYSTKFNNFACYTSQSEVDAVPYLYILLPDE